MPLGFRICFVVWFERSYSGEKVGCLGCDGRRTDCKDIIPFTEFAISKYLLCKAMHFRASMQLEKLQNDQPTNMCSSWATFPSSLGGGSLHYLCQSVVGLNNKFCKVQFLW